MAPVRFRTRAEVAKAREEIYALVKAKVLSAPTGTTCLMALRDQDASRDRGEQLALDRKGRRPQEHRLVVRLEPWAVRPPPPPPPALKRVGPAPEAPR